MLVFIRTKAPRGGALVGGYGGRDGGGVSRPGGDCSYPGGGLFVDEFEVVDPHFRAFAAGKVVAADRGRHGTHDGRGLDVVATVGERYLEGDEAVAVGSLGELEFAVGYDVGTVLVKDFLGSGIDDHGILGAVVIGLEGAVEHGYVDDTVVEVALLQVGIVVAGVVDGRGRVLDVALESDGTTGPGTTPAEDTVGARGAQEFADEGVAGRELDYHVD